MKICTNMEWMQKENLSYIYQMQNLSILSEI